MSLHPEDMTSLLPAHGLQGDPSENDSPHPQMDHSDNIDGGRNILQPLMASRGPRNIHPPPPQRTMPGHQAAPGHQGHRISVQQSHPAEGYAENGGSGQQVGGSAGASAATRRDHNIDYSTLFVQLSGTFPTLYRCVSCHKTVSNRWHHANIHRPQSHECPVCGQKFTRRDNMKAHCKIKHAEIKDHFFSHYVHM